MFFLMLLFSCLIQCTMHQSDHRSFNDISQYEVSTQVALHTSYCKDKSQLSVSRFLKGGTVTKVDIAVCNNSR